MARSESPAGRALLVAVLAVACTPRADRPTAPGPTPAPPAPPTPAPQSPPDSEVPDPLDTTIPLLGGGGLELRRFRAMPRLLYFAAPDAADEDLARLASWAADVARGGREPGPVVVLVATAEAHDRVVDLWGIPPPGVYYGWDPQGAAAARLAIRSFPAAILVDAKGRVRLRRVGPKAADLSEIGRKARVAAGAPDW